MFVGMDVICLPRREVDTTRIKSNYDHSAQLCIAATCQSPALLPPLLPPPLSVPATLIISPDIARLLVALGKCELLRAMT